MIAATYLIVLTAKLRLNLGTLFKNNARHLSIGTSGFFLLYNLDLGRGEKPISRSFIETGIIDAFLVLGLIRNLNSDLGKDGIIDAFLVLELIRNLNLDMDDLWVNLGMDWNPVYFYIYVI